MSLVQLVSELLGYASIGCWLCAQFPQIMVNMKRQSCEGLALPFLFSWMLGDTSNLAGCLLTHQLPFQTYLATYFCSVDACLLFQYFYYGGSPRMPPIAYPRARSRTISSARRLSIDASHYRTMSTAAVNIAAATTLATHSETHPQHRHPKKLDADLLIDEQSVTQHPSDAPLDESTDAVLSTLTDSFHSEAGWKKRVSWSQERREHPTGGSSRRHILSTVPGALRHTPTSAAALLARGRPPRREEESEDLLDEQTAEAVRRDTSRASRRSVGLVLLGMGVLFGIGRYTDGTQPMVARGAKTGAVLAPTSTLDLSPSTGLPVMENTHNDLTDPLLPYVEVELPLLLNDGGFSQQQQPDGDTSYDHFIGRIFAWICATLYLTSRLPQIWKNYARKSAEGLSIYLFVFAFLGNLLYVLSIVTSHDALLPPPASTEFYSESLPYLLGSGGTFFFDVTIVVQYFIYKGKHPRRSYIRSRGGSLVRGAAIAEETAGLLRGDALAAARTHSEWVQPEGVVPRSRSRG